MSALNGSPAVRRGGLSQTDCDYFFKILVVGESSVGKSCLLLRFADDSFSDAFVTTIGVDFKSKVVSLDGKKVRLQVWDTAGQERFRTITRSYYRGAHGVMLAFSVCDPNSFRSVGKWITDIHKFSHQETPIVLVGTKIDLVDKRVIDYDVAKQLADRENLKYFETSAKLGTNVGEGFVALAKEIIEKNFVGKVDDDDDGVDVDGAKKTNGGCC